MSTVELPKTTDSFRSGLERQIQLMKRVPCLGQDCSTILSNTRGQDVPEPLIRQIIGGGSSHDTYYNPFRWKDYIEKVYPRETISLLPLVVSNSIKYTNLSDDLIRWNVSQENVSDVHLQHSQDLQQASARFGTYIAWVGLFNNFNLETMLDSNRNAHPRNRLLPPWRFANLREALLFTLNYETHLLDNQVHFTHALGSRDDREDKDWIPSSYRIYPSINSDVPPFTVDFQSAILSPPFEPLVVFTPATW